MFELGGIPFSIRIRHWNCGSKVEALECSAAGTCIFSFWIFWPNRSSWTSARGGALLDFLVFNAISQGKRYWYAAGVAAKLNVGLANAEWSQDSFQGSKQIEWEWWRKDDGWRRLIPLAKETLMGSWVKCWNLPHLAVEGDRAHWRGCKLNLARSVDLRRAWGKGITLTENKERYADWRATGWESVAVFERALVQAAIAQSQELSGRWLHAEAELRFYWSWEGRWCLKSELRETVSFLRIVLSIVTYRQTCRILYHRSS